MRAQDEDEEWDEEPILGHGHIDAGTDRTAASDTFLYVPDLSVETGWSVFRVRKDAGAGRGPLGFRRDRSS